jgi:hypothetical protein
MRLVNNGVFALSSFHPPLAPPVKGGGFINPLPLTGGGQVKGIGDNFESGTSSISGGYHPPLASTAGGEEHENPLPWRERAGRGGLPLRLNTHSDGIGQLRLAGVTDTSRIVREKTPDDADRSAHRHPTSLLGGLCCL